jgi:hypothetical protein
LEDKNNNLNQSQIDIIIGTILGDASLKNTSKSSYLNYEYANKDYTEFVFNNLNYLTENKKISETNRFDARYNKIRTAYHFITNSHNYLKNLSELFYRTEKKGNKKVNIKCLPDYNTLFNLISPRALAYWIMDDGSNFKRGGITLCTDNFTLDEVLRLKSVLENKFNFICTIHHKKNKDGSKFYPRIYISKNSMPSLISLVEKYMLDSMKYKISYEFIERKPLSLKPKNIRSRLLTAEKAKWIKDHGDLSGYIKPNRVYSSNPRAIKARLKRLELKQSKVDFININ